QAQIHHSIGPHPNIVTLHQTLETPSYLLLVLEYVPGEDLFYFLEQSRDGHSSVTAAAGSPRSQSNTNSNCHSGCESSHSSGGSTPFDSDEMGTGMVNTPPTPSLLSSVRPGVMFSQARLKLVASMFKQMCDAVQACHSRGIAHRDIKPENFIVTKAVVPTSSQLPAAAAAAESLNEQRVVVKLSDFGLATVERESADVDCGSAPYMSFGELLLLSSLSLIAVKGLIHSYLFLECRNNVGPTYTTQPAGM
ncbi:kinase-like domain-containing protein, partial [Cantharellus anzutake]|uniref:kinase-like domain-containing protein n=1 Tax=Cantharellus anzutake TaxID=1750568 RepID=UPI001904EEAC